MTLSQLLRSRKPLPPTVVITGRHPGLLLLGIQTYAKKRRVSAWSTLSASTNPILMLLQRLSARSTKPTLLVYQDLQEAQHLSRLLPYLKQPTANVSLVLTSPERGPKRDKESRWLIEQVGYVDCPSGGDAAQLVTLAKAYGVAKDSAAALVSRVNDDPDLLLEAFRLLALFPKPWDDGLIEQIVPETDDVISFSNWHVLDRVSDHALCEQLQRRFRQLALLNIYRNADLSFVELAGQAHLEPFLLREFKPLVRHTSSEDWIRRMATVEVAKEAASKHLPLVREYIKTALS